MSKEKLKIHTCILLLGLVGICIKFGTAVSSEIEHERNVSVKVQNFAQNSIMPIDEVNTIELSTADSNIYYVVNRVGNKVNNIGFINPYTSLEFIGGGGHLIDQSPLPYYLEGCKVAGTRCWKDIHKLFVWLDEVQASKQDL